MGTGVGDGVGSGVGEGSGVGVGTGVGNGVAAAVWVSEDVGNGVTDTAGVGVAVNAGMGSPPAALKTVGCGIGDAPFVASAGAAMPPGTRNTIDTARCGQCSRTEYLWLQRTLGERRLYYSIDGRLPKPAFF